MLISLSCSTLLLTGLAQALHADNVVESFVENIVIQTVDNKVLEPAPIALLAIIVLGLAIHKIKKR